MRKISIEMLEQKLLSCLYYDDRYDRLADVLTEYFGRTVLLISPSGSTYNIIKSAEENEILQANLEHRKKNPRYSVNAFEDIRKWSKEDKPYIMDNRLLNVTMLRMNIKDKMGNSMGRISVLTKKNYRITEEDTKVLEIAAKVIALAIQISEARIEINDEKTQWNDLLECLLSEKYENYELFLKELENRYNVYPCSEYRLVVGTKTSLALRQTEFKRLYDALSNAGSKCLGIVYFQNHVVALFGDEEKTFFSHGGELEKIAVKEYMYMMYSDPLDNLWKIKSLYDHMVYQVNLMVRRQFVGHYAAADDYKLDTIILNTKTYSGSLADYVSSVLFQMRKYDDDKGTEYIDTLRGYLNNGFSIPRTADALFIHRTTVAYRLKQMQEIFDLDFKDSRKCLQLQVSMYIMDNYL